MSKDIQKRSLEINAVLNIVKQCCSIIFPLITFPYISRCLGNEGYGIYSFSWSFVSYFIMIAALGISTYSIREGARIRDNKKELEIFTAQIFTINVISSVVAIGALFAIALLNDKLNEYLLYIFIESFAIILSLLGRDWLNSVYEDYLYITIRYIVIQLISLVAMFIFVKNSNDVWKYCVLCIFASYGGNIPNIFYTRRYSKYKITTDIQLNKHIIPLLTLFANTLAMMVFVNSDVIMLGFLFNNKTVGVYSFSSKIYSMIKQILNAVVIVALPRFASIIGWSQEEYNKLLRRVFGYLLILLIPVSIGLFMLSDSIILLAGGADYVEGNMAMKVLSVSVIFAMIGSFMMNCVLIVNRQDTKCIASTLVAAASNVLLNILLLRRLGIIGAAITTLIAEFINAVLMTYFSRKIARSRIVEKRNLLECLIGGILVAIICFILNSVASSALTRIAISVPVSLMIYCAVMAATKNEFFIEFTKPICSRLNSLRRSKTI